VFAAPGNAGTASRGLNWASTSATDGRAIAARAIDERIDLVVLGPETAIAAAVGDRLREAGLLVFGPDRSAGRLETSKIFAKRFMQRHGVPTAHAVVVHSLEGARKALVDWTGGVVVKADGLASGKGVVVCDTVAVALEVLGDWYGAGRVPGGGADVLLERRLAGREVSVFALCDGASIVPFAAACDYKRAGDGDTGPNTGGMGAYSPPVGFPDDMMDVVRERVLEPVLRGLSADGERYIGVLYCGLMWTDDGPCVIEFNARFGDPETQAIVPLIDGDFAALLHSVASGSMDAGLARVSDRACTAVVLATPEYPRISTPLRGLNGDVAAGGDAQVFWGTSLMNGDRVDASGGRVLTVTGTGDDAPRARAHAYDAVRVIAGKIGTRELSFRTDIGRV
jgi:phosphoribosylamine--glycine ligase